MTTDFIRPHSGGIYISLKVQPRAAKNEIGEVIGAELKVKVTAPPVDSAANEALLRLLSDVLNCPRNAVELVRGQTSRHKVVFVSGVTPAQAMTRLQNK
jgi:uncharacterized protein